MYASYIWGKTKAPPANVESANEAKSIEKSEDS